MGMNGSLCRLRELKKSNSPNAVGRRASGCSFGVEEWRVVVGKDEESWRRRRRAKFCEFCKIVALLETLQVNASIKERKKKRRHELATRWSAIVVVMMVCVFV
jgi:hypothetical protein